MSDMLIPKGTIIECTSAYNEDSKFICEVAEIDFDFDPEYVNGIKIKNKKYSSGSDGDPSQDYVDNIEYYIRVVKYPDEYYQSSQHWIIAKDRVSECPYLFSDKLVENNKWLLRDMEVIEYQPSSLTYKEAKKIYNSYFKNWSKTWE